MLTADRITHAYTLANAALYKLWTAAMPTADYHRPTWWAVAGAVELLREIALAVDDGRDPTATLTLVGPLQARSPLDVIELLVESTITGVIGEIVRQVGGDIQPTFREAVSAGRLGSAAYATDLRDTVIRLGEEARNWRYIAETATHARTLDADRAHELRGVVDRLKAQVAELTASSLDAAGRCASCREQGAALEDDSIRCGACQDRIAAQDSR